MSAEPLSLTEYMTVTRFDKAPAAPESFDATAAVRRVVAVLTAAEDYWAEHSQSWESRRHEVVRIEDIRRAVEGQT